MSDHELLPIVECGDPILRHLPNRSIRQLFTRWSYTDSSSGCGRPWKPLPEWG